MRVGVLGPVTAWGPDGTPLDLKGPRHRAVLARLAVARGRVVPLGRLIDDLWDDPPSGAAGAIRTFVGALRKAIDPRRPPMLLVTQGRGYALRPDAGSLDALVFDELCAAAADAGRAGGAPSRVLALADAGLRLWRGPAYAEFADEPWAVAECSRLTEARLALVERQAEARLALGRAADAVPDLAAHVGAHPWREDGWRLLALALYRTGRQADALGTIRRARVLLAEELGLDPGPRLAGLERDMLRQAPGLELRRDGDALTVTAGAFERVAPAYARSRVTTAAVLAGSLALVGGDGLRAAAAQRLAAIEEAETLGDPELTARVIGGFAVPAIWTRSDDPEAAARIVAAAERSLAALSAGTLSTGTLSADALSAGPHAAARARLLTTIALESRGSTAARPREAAAEAEAIARRLGDPGLLAYALNGVWMQTHWRTGLAAERDRIGEEIIALASRHGLADFAVLGRLIRLQALSAHGNADAADGYAAELDRLGERHERPGVAVFTGWYRAMRAGTAAAYRAAARLLDGCGMPGVADGLLPLALLCHRIRAIGHGGQANSVVFTAGTSWGPYEPWARPWLLLAGDPGGRPRCDRIRDARDALAACPDPPPGLLAEALWCLTARAASLLGDEAAASRARDALTPAAGEIAAGSGMLTAGPVRDYL